MVKGLMLLKECSIHIKSVELTTVYNLRKQRDKVSVTPSFVLTHSSDSIFWSVKLDFSKSWFAKRRHPLMKIGWQIQCILFGFERSAETNTRQNV